MKATPIWAACCLCASIAAAQTGAPAPEQAPVTSEKTSAPANLTLAPSASASPIMQVLFEASKDDKEGKVAFGWRTSHEQFELSASSPLTQGSATPLSLDGLSNGAKGTLKWNHLSRASESPADYEGIEKICEPLRNKKMEEAIATADVAWKETIAAAKEHGTPLPPEPAILVAKEKWDKARADRKPGDAEPQKPFELMFPCLNRDFPEGSMDRWKLEEYGHVNAPILLFGADVAVARTKFEYLDDALMSQDPSHFGGSVTVRAGILKPAIASGFVSYTHVEDHLPKNDPETVCQPIDNTAATTCSDVVRGKPDEVKRDTLSFEVRRFFNSTTAVSPSFKYDFTNHVKAVEVPIYFISGSGVAGGVKFNWRSDKHEVTAVVFVSAALGLLP